MVECFDDPSSADGGAEVEEEGKFANLMAEPHYRAWSNDLTVFLIAKYAGKAMWIKEGVVAK